MIQDDSIFRVDETSDLPIWVQLRNRMAYLIRTGRFKGGDPLPSIRSLSAAAEINYGTVTRAYRDLELGGLIVSVRGRGMFVQKHLPLHEDEGALAADAAARDCISQYRALGMTFADIEARMLSVISDMKDKAHEAATERMEYYGEE